MAKANSKKGKGKFARYRVENRQDKNKLKREAKLTKKLAKRKTWKKKKFESFPVEKLSKQIRTFFKKTGFRKEEILTYERSAQFKKKQYERRKEGLLKQCSCGVKFNYVCIPCLEGNNK